MIATDKEVEVAIGADGATDLVGFGPDYLSVVAHVRPTIGGAYVGKNAVDEILLFFTPAI